MDELLESLSKGLVHITFTKVDGTVREIIATKNFDIIPSDRVPSGTGTLKSGVISVYDVENDGWRSFRPEYLIKWSVE